MQFYYRKNLLSPSVKESQVCPWKVAIPENSFKDKKEAERYWADIKTEHYFYSPCCGQNKELVLTKNKDNPPRSLSAFVADYDAEFVFEEVLPKILRRSRVFAPSYYSETFSGGCRLIWPFEKEINVPVDGADKAFMQRIKKELNLDKLLPGFDEKSLSLYHYWEIGKKWYTIDPGTKDQVIPYANLESWVVDSYKKFNAGGGNIPIERVKEKLAQIYPDYSFEDFDIGARIRPWWMPEYQKKACLVREDGILVFSTTVAEKSFLPWGDSRLLGLVAQTEEEAINSRSTENIWFDGNKYWRKIEGQYQDEKKEDIKLHLSVCENLSTASVKGKPSQVDKALYFMHNRRRIFGTFPFIFNPKEIVYYQGDKILNISKTRLVKPQEGNYYQTFISKYIRAMLKEEEQVTRFYSWLAHFYQSALTGELKRGQHTIFAGKAGSGKNFMGDVILSGLFGGSADCSEHILGGDKYNDKLFSKAIWLSHDKEEAKNGNSASTQILKKYAANDNFLYRPMFVSGVMRPWVGRIIITMNDDPISLQVLPQLDLNTADKFNFFFAHSHDVKFPSMGSLQIKNDLPVLAHYLSNYKIPKEIQNDRWGVEAYQHPKLVEASKVNSRSFGFKDLLDMWRKNFFNLHTDQKHWEGTPTELYDDLLKNHRDLALSYRSANMIGTHLQNLLKIKAINEYVEYKNRKYIIKR